MASTAMSSTAFQADLEALRSSPTSIVDIEVSERCRSILTVEESVVVQRVIVGLQKTDSDAKSVLLPFPRQKFALPTVEEVDGSTCHEPGCDDSRHSQQDDTVSMDKDKAQRLNTVASNYALRGKEKMALKTYKNALTLSTNEVGRIQRRMKQALKEPEYLRKSVHQLLNKEWTEVALIIADIKTMMTIIYERTGDYDRAIKCCREARDVHERQLKQHTKSKSKDFLLAQENATKVQRIAKKLEKAKTSAHQRNKLHGASRKLHGELAVAVDPGVREILFGAIFDKLSSVLGLEIESLGQNHPQVADTLAYISKLHLERNDQEMALLAMERAVFIAEVALGNLHPRTADKFYKLGRQYETANRDKIDETNAITCYEKALETYNETEGKYSRRVATISNDLGVLLLKQGQHGKAIGRLSDALDVYGSSGVNKDVVCADTAQVWRNLAECYVIRGEWDMAVRNFTSALKVQRDGRIFFETVRPNNPNIDMPPLIQDESIADTLKRLGKAYAADKKYDKAYSMLLEALSIFQTACEQAKRSNDTNSPLTLARKQDQLANIVYCLGEVKESNSKYDEALKLYDESMELRVYSDKLRPKEGKLNHVHCAMCMAGIGNIRMKKNQHNLAFQAFNDAIQSTRKQELSEYHPIVKMLWDKSRTAVRKMADEEQGLVHIIEEGIEIPVNVIIPQDGEDKSLERDDNENEENLPPKKKEKTPSQCSAWFHTTSRLEKKAKSRKKKGDIDGAIEATRTVLEFRIAYLAKREESKKTTAQAKQQVARTIVSLAHLALMKEEGREAEQRFREAMDSYKSSGLTKQDGPIMEIRRELDRLKWQSKAAQSKS